MKVLSIGFDRELFDDGSEARERLSMQSTLFDELHIIVFSKKTHGLEKREVAPRVWLYPTNSLTRWLYVRDAVSIGNEILAERKGADWLVTSQDPFETGIVGRQLSLSWEIPWEAQVHTDFLNPHFAALSLLNKVRVFIAKKILPHADGIRVVSRRIKESLAPLSLKDTPHVLPVYVDFSRFLHTSPSNFLSENYPQFSFIVLTVCRLSFEKDLTTALRAFSRFSVTFPGAGFVIVGDGPAKPLLQKEAKRLGIGEKVVFAGKIDAASLPRYYASAHLFVQTSLYEGYGRSILEAALAGLPVISTDAGIARDLLGTPGFSGWCAVGDVGCLASHMIALGKDEKLRAAYREGVREKAVTFTHSFDSYTSEYRKIFETTYARKTKHS